ncbi:MAG: DUF2752 domain-containing protein [Verrucomicrobiae bacterium]|nr:DUF2752 domain-containing protein [Verrucomicrobiae bacterium]
MKTAMIGGGVMMAVWILKNSAKHFFPPCPFHALTGWYCPGCGSTRALHQLLHGHLVAACRFNPLTVCVLPALGIALALWCRRQPVRSAWLWTLVSVVAFFGILRNLPFPPFSSWSPQP